MTSIFLHHKRSVAIDRFVCDLYRSQVGNETSRCLATRLGMWTLIATWIVGICWGFLGNLSEAPTISFSKILGCEIFFLNWFLEQESQRMIATTYVLLCSFNLHLTHPLQHMGVAKNRGTPKMDGLIMESPIKIDDLGEPLFLETPMWHQATFTPQHPLKDLEVFSPGKPIWRWPFPASCRWVSWRWNPEMQCSQLGQLERSYRLSLHVFLIYHKMFVGVKWYIKMLQPDVSPFVVLL